MTSLFVLSLLVLSVLMMDLMVTEVVLVLDMVGKVGRAAIQHKITSIRDTFGSRTCHTYTIFWLQSRCVV